MPGRATWGLARGNRANEQGLWEASFVLSRGCGAHWFLWGDGIGLHEYSTGWN